MRSKVLNRNGTFVGIEGVTGADEILFAPFVLNRNASRATEFDDSEEPGAREVESEASAMRRIPEREKVMGVCEAP
jgi:hypothetical protein